MACRVVNEPFPIRLIDYLVVARCIYYYIGLCGTGPGEVHKQVSQPASRAAVGTLGLCARSLYIHN